jgi:Fe2+ transport system protein FeoA
MGLRIKNPKPKTQNQSPLSMSVAGQELRLDEIRAGRRLTHRLAELGLTPGVTLRVVQKNGGPLLISVRGSRIAIGRGLAHKLLVTPVE